MDVLFLLAAVVLFALLALSFGNDSRPIDDSRPWWPGSRPDADWSHRA